MASLEDRGDETSAEGCPVKTNRGSLNLSSQYS